MTRSEIAQKYGSFEIADAIIAAKEGEPEIARTQIRPHPDMHGVDTPETWLVVKHLVWTTCLIKLDLLNA